MTKVEELVLLLAEDDDADVLLLKRAFERAGFKPKLLVAGDGEQALEALAAQPRVDLLVTDLKMPRMNGLDLLAKLRESKGSPRACVLTSSDEDKDRAEATRLGAADYLLKPMSSEEWGPVIARLRELLEGG